MHFELIFVLLFGIATAVAIAARYFKLPYTVALVVAGLVLGTAHAFEPPHLTKELLFAIILPGLLFEAAFHLEARKFWANKLAIHSLAIPGLIVAIALTAAILAPVVDGLHFVDGFGFIHGLVFASVIMATDPIAVVGLFKNLGAPKRLAVLVEGESLLNDGTAVVLFTLVLAVATGGAFTFGGAVLEFVRVAGMGALIGLAFGFTASQIIKRVDDAMVEITLTMIAAYGSFISAEHFHYSGVIATVVAGMLCGNYAARTGMSPSTRVAVASFWEYLAFALNSVVFLLIGLEVQLESLLASWKPILVAFVAVMLARTLVVYGVSGLLRRTREKIPWAWSGVLTWSGLRGAISMVLVLGLPASFPFREVLIHMTFGVVVLSIIVQGLTMGPLLRWLGIAGVKEEYQEAYELARGKLRAATAALGEVGQMRQERSVHEEVLGSLERGYQRMATEAEAEIRTLQAQTEELREEERLEAARRLLVTEKDALQQAFHKGVVGKEAFEQLIAEVDGRLEALEHPGGTSGALPTSEQEGIKGGLAGA
jgi:monovalent cation:H+ antiporter, CPA1 family